jgi:hypothetical protein
MSLVRQLPPVSALMAEFAKVVAEMAQRAVRAREDA